MEVKTLKIPAALHQKLKVKAAVEKTTIEKIAEKALEKAVK